MDSLLRCCNSQDDSWRLTAKHLVMLGLVLLGLSGAIRPVYAEGGLIFNMTLYQTPDLVASGGLVKYRFTFSCSSLQTGCGEVTITDPLPSTLDYVGAVAPSSLAVAHNGGVVTIFRANMLDGDTGEAIIVARVKPALQANTVIENSATARITFGVNDEPTTYPAGPVTVVTTDLIPAWHVEKQRIDPLEGKPAALDSDVTYEVRLCADRLSANYNLANAQLVDTLPANAELVFIQQVHDGEVTVNGNQVTWHLGKVFLSDLYPPESDPAVSACVRRRIVLRYPSSHFNLSDIVTNVVTGADIGGLGPLGSARATHGFDLSIPQVTLNKSAASDTLVPGGTVTWLLEVETTASNIPVYNLTLTDPLALQETLSIFSGTWVPTTIKAEIAFSTNSGASWQVLGNVAGNDSRTWVGAVDFPANLTHVRWSFYDDSTGVRIYRVPSGFAIKADAAIQQRIPVDSPLGKIRNCVDVRFDNGSTPQECHSIHLVAPAPAIRLEKRVADNSNVRPREQIRFHLRFQPDPGGQRPMVNPILSDLLPAELTFVQWESLQMPAGAPGPNLEIIDDYQDSGRQMVRFSWGPTAPVNSTQFNGEPGVSNPYVVPFDLLDSEWIEIEFSAMVNSGVAPGDYSNTVLITDDSPIKRCDSLENLTTDAQDWDGDGDATETACKSSDVWTVMTAVLMTLEKWVRGYPGLSNVDDSTSLPVVSDAQCPNDGDGFTRYPCVARTIPGGNFEYRLHIENIGNVGIIDYVLDDVLPHVGDTGVSELLAGQPRQSRWRPLLAGPVSPEDAFTASLDTVIEYSNSANACRPEMSSQATDSAWQSACVNDWTSTPTDYANVQAIRIRVPFATTPFLPSQIMLFRFPMRASVDAPTVQVAWNTVAHRSTNAESGERILTSEPRKVGIIIPDRLDLALKKTLATGQSPLIHPQQPVTFTLTITNQGNLTATNLLLVDYLPVDFALSPLDHNGWSSNGVTATVALPGLLGPAASRQVNIILAAFPQAEGVYTNTAEICIATDESGVLLDDDSTADCINNELVVKDDVTDENGKMFSDQDEDDHDIAKVTVTPTPRVALGNLVFYDPNNNGRFEPGNAETGVDGVSVALYQAGVDVATVPPLSTTTTAAGGFYLFDELPVGAYFVCISAANFQPGGPLQNLRSSTGYGMTGVVDDDNDENGIDQSDPTQQAICSTAYSLQVGAEPRAETGAGHYPGNLSDDNVNLTIDFGFYPPQVQLGNRLWIEDDADGDATTGVVQPLPDWPVTAISSGGQVFTTTTDTTGYYTFTVPTNLTFTVQTPIPTGFAPSVFVGTPGDNQSHEPTGTVVSIGTVDDLTIDFGFWPALNLGNFVFADRNNNGIWDGLPEEEALAGMVVQLYHDQDNDNVLAAADGAPFATTTTDDAGHYAFAMLRPGAYIVALEAGQFARGGRYDGWQSSTGNDDNSGLAPDPDNDVDNDDNGSPAIGGALATQAVTLAYNAEPDITVDGDGVNGNLTVDFGLWKLAIGDLVWHDLDTDGLYEPATGESGLPDVTLSLYRDNGDGQWSDADGVVLATQSTDGNGRYLFDGLPEGDYLVVVNATNCAVGGALFGFTHSDGNHRHEPAPDPDDNIDNDDNGDLTTACGVAAKALTLTAGDEPTNDGDSDSSTNRTVDFGYYRGVTVGDFVWFDWNGNGLQDRDEAGVPDIPVQLLNADGAPTGLTMLTNAEGRYRFTDLPAGAYAVAFDLSRLPEGALVTTPDVDDNRHDEVDSDATRATGQTAQTPFLQDGDSDLTLDMGIFYPMSLGNRVWADMGFAAETNNGLLDVDERGIASVVVTLFDSDWRPVLAANGHPVSSVTDAGGYYLLDGLAPGNYIVCVDAQNFQEGAILNRWINSQPTERFANENGDNNDNGLTSTDPINGSLLQGVCSDAITLALKQAPTGEMDIGSQRYGAALDNNSNLTIDFGFYLQPTAETTEEEREETGALSKIYIPLIRR
ncbi:MAG: SdrD B-like domain-containing protein [Caldilineaceae bacterium]